MSDLDDIEGFARANRRRAAIYSIIVAGIFIAPLVWVGYSCHSKQQRIAAREEAYRKSLELTPAEVESLKKRVADVKTRIAAQHEAWKKVVTHEELAKIQPSEAPCTMHRFQAPTSGAADSYVQHGSIDANYFGSFYVVRIPAGKDFGLPFASELAAAEALEKKLADGTANRNDQRSIDLENAIPFIVVEKESAPIVTTSVAGIGGFIPGELIGRAYVYSASAQRITCAADLVVSNSESVKFDFSYMQGNYLDKEYKMREAGKATLERDLEVRIRQTLASQLREVTR